MKSTSKQSSRSASAAHRPRVASKLIGHRARARACGLRKPPPALEFYVDEMGRQHFNFRQQVWLDAAVPMAFTPCYTRALQTLAVNVLSLAETELDYRAAVGATSRRAVKLARRFCEECLLHAPAAAWRLPVPVLQSWLAARETRPRQVPLNRLPA